MGERVELAHTTTGDEWLWRPVEHGFFRGESLFDGTIGLAEIAEANDAIDLMLENQSRGVARKRE